MTLNQLAPPYPIFTDKSGSPLDNGYLYFGTAGLNPETNPITVYYDRGFTQPVAQPVRTSSGYVMRNGSPAAIYANSQFSVTVRDKKKALVIYSPVGFGVVPGIPFATFDNSAKDVAALLANTQFTYAAAVPNTIQVAAGDILRTLAEGFAYEVAASGATDQSITTAGGVKLYVIPVWAGANGGIYITAAFGQIGDGIADDQLAVNKAVMAANRAGGGLVHISAGTVRITRPIHLDNFNTLTNSYYSLLEPSRNITVEGAGRGVTIIKPDGFWVSAFTTFPDPYLDVLSVPTYPPLKYKAENIHVRNLTVDMNYNVNPDGGTLYGANYNTFSGTWPDGSTGASTWAADNYQYPFMFERVSGFSITNVEVNNTWYNAFSIYLCEDGLISGNIGSHVCDKANYLGFYCVFEPDAATRNVVFSNNVFKLIGNGIVSNGDASSDNAVENIVVSDNIFEDIEQNGALIFGWLSNWTISNNQFRQIQNGGIIIQASSGAPVATRHPENMIVTGNIIDEFALNNTAEVGIRANMINGVVQGNIIRQFYTTTASVNVIGIIASNDGITVPGDAALGVLVTENQLVGRFKAAALTNGIISCNITNSLIADNTINRVSGAVGSHIVIYGDVIKTAGNAFMGAFGGLSPIYLDPATGPYSNVICDETGPFFSAKLSADLAGTGGTFVTPTFATVLASQYVTLSGSSIRVGAFPGVYTITANMFVEATAGGCNITIEDDVGTVYGQFLSASLASNTVSISAVVKVNQEKLFKVRVYHANNFTVKDTSRITIAKS